MDPQKLIDYVNTNFKKDYIPTLQDFIRIPNLSPFFDPDPKYVLLNKAAEMLRLFAIKCGFANAVLFKDTSPLLVISIDANSKDIKESILLYGHMDKQPWGEGWNPNSGPTDPNIIDDKRLYGRGSADDGYAMFAMLCAIKAVRDLGQKHGQIVIVIEADEESGSGDMVGYLPTIQVNKYLYRNSLIPL
jgi:acetylornithine deacetylase/succinyl-diaminopimelate desuccinylase-like protein